MRVERSRELYMKKHGERVRERGRGRERECMSGDEGLQQLGIWQFGFVKKPRFLIGWLTLFSLTSPVLPSFSFLFLGKLLRSVETNLTFDFYIFISVWCCLL